MDICGERIGRCSCRAEVRATGAAVRQVEEEGAGQGRGGWCRCCAGGEGACRAGIEAAGAGAGQAKKPEADHNVIKEWNEGLWEI